MSDLPLPVGHEAMTEAELLDWLAQEVDHLLRHRREYLMSLCYTLDLDEGGVAGALDPTGAVPANVALAQLLYTRQQQRAATKEKIKPQPLDDENAW